MTRSAPLAPRRPRRWPSLKAPSEPLAWSISLLLALLLMVMALLLPLPAMATTPAPAAPYETAQRPQQLRIGAYLTGLGDLDPAKKSFSAAFWMWSVGSAAEVTALEQLEFPNAIKVESPNVLEEETPQGLWAQRKVVGSFRHEWDLRRFPFDRQRLLIKLEETEKDLSRRVYLADTANSSFDPEASPPGWRIVSTQLVSGSKGYRTSFGDPRLAPGAASAYAKVELRVLLERLDHSAFWKLTVGAFAAALMALASYGLRVDQNSALGSRFGLLAGSIFAAVISLRSAASELGAIGYFTLIDAVHGAILLYILVATAAGVLAWRGYLRHGDVAKKQRFERRIAGFSSLIFGALVLSLVLGAMTQQSL